VLQGSEQLLAPRHLLRKLCLQSAGASISIELGDAPVVMVRAGEFALQSVQQLGALP
jgi:hypothetical protein